MKAVASILTLLAVAIVASADCRTVVRQQQVYQQAYDYTPVAAAYFVPVTVAQYSVGFAPAPAAQTPTPAMEGFREMIEELKKLRATVEGIAGGQPKLEPLPPLPEKLTAPQKTPAHLAVFRAKCATCHEATVAAAKGNGFTLMTGDVPAPLTDAQKLDIVRRIYSGDPKYRMPRAPLPELTNEDVAAVIGSLK